MKHGGNPRRLRNRGNGKRHPGLRNQTFESNGPDGKIRGTAQQVLDRYLALARDATSAGDPITAESFFQHAEHYHRIMHAAEGYSGDRGGQPVRTSAHEGDSNDDGTVQIAAGDAQVAADEGDTRLY